MTRAAIAKIHVARKQLALSEENYRSILIRITGQDTSSVLNDRQVDDVLAEFRRLGWRPKKAFKPSDKPFVRMIYALWKEAARVGAVSTSSKPALRAFVERQTRRGGKRGIDDPEFLRAEDARRVTEALKAMIKRAEEHTCTSGEAIDA